MEFVAILICLAVERWTSVGKTVRYYQLLEKYIGSVGKWIQKLGLPSWLALSLILLPLMIVVWFVYIILLQFWFGLASLVFIVFMLFYCFGPFSISEEGANADGILIQASRNIFSVLFWFAVLGPIGALLYRLNNLLVSEGMGEISVAAERFQTILEWIPVRLEVLGYAFVSHFKHVSAHLFKHFLSGLEANERLLIESGNIALEIDSANVSKEAIRLIDRALVVWLAVMAIIILL